MEHYTMQIFSIGSWLFAALTFVIGVLVKYIFNVLSTPKLEIEEYVVVDSNSKPWIRVHNRSNRIKAYGLRIFVAFYQKDKRIHTKLITDGVMKNKDTEKYSITPKNEKKEDILFDNAKWDNYVEVTITYKNKFNTLFVKEKRVIYED